MFFFRLLFRTSWERNHRKISEVFKANSNSSCHFHSATHTILDLEKTVTREGFKNPKSMKDIEKILRLTFAMDQEGFFKIPNAKPEPANLKGTPPNFDLQKVSSPTLETHSIASLEIKFSELGFLKSTTECSYFKGGEKHA